LYVSLPVIANVSFSVTHRVAKTKKVFLH